MLSYNRAMATNRITIDLGPDEQSRLDAESRRRGVAGDAVIVEMVRALPRPDAAIQMRKALAGLEELWQRIPEISNADIEAALRTSREELESRTDPDAAQ
jgi:hypothetical protein